MINIDSFYRAVLDFLNKNNGQYISPSEFIRCTKLASLDYFKELKGGKLNTKNVYGKNRILDYRLNPFRKRGTITFVNGIGVKPSDMELIRSLNVTVNSKPKRVRYLEELRFADTFDNPLADGIESDPIFCEREDDELEIHPTTFTSGIINYLEAPKDPVWNYTLAGRKPVYNPTGSVDLQWDKAEEPQLLMRTLNYLGLNIRDATVLQFSEKEQQKN